MARHGNQLHRLIQDHHVVSRRLHFDSLRLGAGIGLMENPLTTEMPLDPLMVGHVIGMR